MLGRFLLFVLFVFLVTACKEDESSESGSGSTAPVGDVIVLNAATTYQTITGWEEPVVSTVRDYYPMLAHMDAVRDQAINDLGINKMAIAMTAGVENPSGTCQAQYLDRALSEPDYVSKCAYASVNDNPDPGVVNPNGFHFDILDWQIENLVIPSRQRLEARGEKLYLQLRYVDFGPSSFEHYQNPEEYAELMQVAFDHMKSKYGFTPDGIDIMNEPDDVAGWRPPALAASIVAAGRRLEARGYRPDFIGPSTVSKARAPIYFDEIIAVAGVNRYLNTLSWHCYAENTSDASAAIGSRAVQHGVGTSMTECWHNANTYVMLHQELKASRNGSWQLGILNGANGYYDVNAATGQATLRPKARFIRQYFRHVRAGARRIEATTASATFDPVAFINRDGTYVVVIKAAAGGTFMIRNLPAAAYGTFYTTGPNGLTVANYDVAGPDRTLARGQEFTGSIPAAGVITVYAKRSASNAAATLVPQSQRAVVAQVVTNLAAANAPAGYVPAANMRVSVEAEETGGRRANPSPAARAHWHVESLLVAQGGVRVHVSRIPGDVVDPVDFGFTPDGRVFVAERDGRIRVVRDGRVLTLPALSRREWGDDAEQEEFLALAVDPAFTANHHVYTMSTTNFGAGQRSFRVARYREVADTLADRVVVLDGVEADPDQAAGALRFGPDGKLFAAFDDAGTARLAGDFASPNGKVLRLNSDGTTPADQAGGNPLFSYPYRSPRGFGWDPSGHALWVADRDSSTSSRLMLVASEAARKRGQVQSAVGLPQESIVSSVAYYAGDADGWTESIFVASEEGRHLLRLQVNPQNRTQLLGSERLLQDSVGPIRVVGVSRDGTIYFGTRDALGSLKPQAPVRTASR